MDILSEIRFRPKDEIIFALMGGALISLATTINFLLKGRLTGFSGIFFSLFGGAGSSLYWKLAFISGVINCSSLMFLKFGFDPIKPKNANSTHNIYAFDHPVSGNSDLSIMGFLVAAFLVGTGKLTIINFRRKTVKRLHKRPWSVRSTKAFSEKLGCRANLYALWDVHCYLQRHPRPFES